MKLDKAIKILTELSIPGIAVYDTKDINAIKLGIEGLKRCLILAENSPLWRAKPLPGETKD